MIADKLVRKTLSRQKSDLPVYGAANYPIDRKRFTLV